MAEKNSWEYCILIFRSLDVEYFDNLSETGRTTVWQTNPYVIGIQVIYIHQQIWVMLTQLFLFT